ncbi:hypothetical protein COLO4_08617 [Corchorus olitorius]|uniref:Late embryogenesis abundant protein, LEA-14 n=1 Tax=Corchorus olitorius TaxID=93759 RepID=A0A1R3KF34_9ROSI|nr:hypothetical protein COLO4_08617 [Corchorus olitorius]
MAKGDRPYDFSPLVQEANYVVPMNEEPYSSQSEENENVSSQPDTSSNLFESANRLFIEIVYFAGILMIMAILLYCVCLYIINIHFDYPRPLLETKSLVISSLNISDSNSIGIWDANFTFGHSMNDYAEVTYYKILRGFIYYKQVSNLHARSDLLATAKATTFNVRQKEYTRVHLEFKTTKSEVGQPTLEDQVIKEISKEVENGVMHFSLEIVVEAEFQKWGKIWPGSETYGYGTSWYGWDIVAGIDRVTEKGRLMAAMPIHKSFYLH